jgi:hypothetical protein
MIWRGLTVGHDDEKTEQTVLVICGLTIKWGHVRKKKVQSKGLWKL